MLKVATLAELIFNVFATVLILAVTTISLADSKPSDAKFPVIKKHGPAYPVPGAVILPEKDLVYKVVFDVTKPSPDKNTVNKGLNHAARFLNLMASADFPKDKLDIVVIFHGKAGVDALKDEYYSKKVGHSNPNEKLINELKSHGVRLLICGQTLADEKFNEDWLNSNIEVTLSALVALSTYQLKGYAWLPF